MTATAIPTGAPDEAELAGPLQDVFANLLPEEIVAGRRLAELKRRMALGLAALVSVLILIYGFSWWQTTAAHHSLSSAKNTAAKLQVQKDKFAPLVTAQTQSATIQSALRQLMLGDLDWTQMLTALGSTAHNGLKITAIDGTLTTGAAAATSGNAGFNVLNQTGSQSVGSMTINGSAPDKATIASFVDALATVPGLAAPFPASVTTVAGGHQIEFSINVIITTKALGGHYSANPSKNPAVGTVGGH